MPDSDESTLSNDVAAMLDQSHDDWPGTRLSAIESLERHADANRAAFERLRTLLDDGVVTVGVAAAGALVKAAGAEGLEAVLDYLGSHVDDPDSDYVTYMLEELQGSGAVSVPSVARKIASNDPTDSVRRGLERIESYFGRLG